MRSVTDRPVLLVVALALIVGAIAVLELRLGAATPEDAGTQETTAEAVDDGAGEETSGVARGTALETTREATSEEDTREPEFPRAKEIVGATGFVNADSVSIEEYVRQDRVVLLDFWTYSCYNCQNVQPYMNAWHEEYADDGLRVVGVHKPEFEWEKDAAGVEAAVREAGIRYPVVLDNNDATWDAYDQRYWPTMYLIDAEGNIRYKHVGEGAYGETEGKIRVLLAEADGG